MKSVTLRTLLRNPATVKALTRRGEKVPITEKGEPLWTIYPAAPPTTEWDIDEDERIRAIDEILDEVLNETPGKISTLKMLDYARDDIARLKPNRRRQTQRIS